MWFEQTKWRLLLPDPHRMAELISQHSDHFILNWWATFSVSVAASILALFLAIVLSITSLRFRAVDIALLPLVALSQSFPLQAIAPLIIVLLGVGFKTKAIIAFTIAFFPIYGVCVSALKALPKPLLAHLAICRTTFSKGTWFVRLPAALPSIVSSAKVGFTLAVLGAVVAEFIHPDKGIGSLILIAQSNYDIEVIYLCVLILVLQGIAIYGLLSYLEWHILKSRRI